MHPGRVLAAPAKGRRLNESWNLGKMLRPCWLHLLVICPVFALSAKDAPSFGRRNKGWNGGTVREDEPWHGN